MAKDPAVLFYPNDFLVGTAFFTNEQVGAYMRILSYLFDKGVKGTMTIYELKAICVTDDCWNAIKMKFVKDADGNLYNERARSEKIRRVRFSDSRRKNRLSKESDDEKEKDMSIISSSSDEDMENENEDEGLNESLNENRINKGKPVPGTKEYILFNSWGKHAKNLTIHERDELIKIWDLADQDPVKLEEAFRQSIKYGAKKFIYVEKVLEGMKEKAGAIAAKKHEHEASLLKIEEAKEFKPDPKTAKVFTDMLKELNMKTPAKVVSDHTQSEEYKKKKAEYDKKLNEG